ncbi:MAG: putative nucleic acid-binding Zn-ribbon protein [Candidatus Woesearchaeota archaeon]|jgi:predicted  nucleic acid-binding Zn-ribbon protein
MPHQCVRCAKLYDDGSQEILTGCSCGAKLFYYVRRDQLNKAKNDRSALDLSEQEREKIEKDIYDIIGDEVDKNIPIILDIESVKVLKPGSFELDLVNLFNKENPLVYRLEEGKYMIDLANSFKRAKSDKKESE